MKKTEFKEIMDLIAIYYPSFTYDQQKFDAWLSIIRKKNLNFEDIKANLETYVVSNKFVPSLSDLIDNAPHKGRAIPTMEETRHMLDKREEERPKEKVDPTKIEGYAELMEMFRKNRRGIE